MISCDGSRSACFHYEDYRQRVEHAETENLCSSQEIKSLKADLAAKNATIKELTDSLQTIKSFRGQRMQTHELKTHPEYFKNVKRGLKKAEIRFDDRDFMIGDTVILKEFMPVKKEFTGQVIEKKISDITRLCFVIPNLDHRWCVLHLEEV